MNVPSGGPASQAGMRRRNLALVLRTVAERGPLSRASVANEVGLTRAAVSTLVEDLLAAGLLAELGPERSQRGRVGRPGSALRLAAGRSAPVGLGAEIGVDHLAVCAVDLRGAVLAHVHEETDNRGRPPSAVVGRLAELAAKLTEGLDAGGPPAGLAVAVPGLVGDPADGVVARAPNLDWTEEPVAAPLRDRLGGLPVTVDNEANLGALAEMWLCRPPGVRDFLHVSAGIGVGAALVMDGRLRRGARGFAGELGHVPVRPSGPVCSCGARGCLEQYAGEEAVLRAAGIDPAEAARQAGPAGRVRLLAERARRGDGRVRGALVRAGTALGIALAGTVNLLDPAAVVLGGGFAEVAPWALAAVQRELAERLPARGVPRLLEVSVLGREGPLLGAGNSVIRGIVEDPVGYWESRAR
ncbi:ROK family protein [Mangrovactinospora gilvigrisea]|uniref:ROK family protein n=1 Tax=Mangrovactinospora gilvigrisea TaxID=1428644 RepID=A0A1J7BBK9_9ACTN|nr:ROK family protein [Mangrovactinospora gilvigrisea]OIV35989.1 ROK family protein [Mangrovactinospora gilvigrisea]